MQKAIRYTCTQSKIRFDNWLLNGAFKSLENCDIELNKESFNVFYDAVNEKLLGSKDVEYEWTEKNMMQIRCLHVDNLRRGI